MNQKTGSQEHQQTQSLLIPALVGFVLLVVIVTLVLSFQTVRSAPGIAIIPTEEPLPTDEVPYPNVPRISVLDAQERVAAGEALIVDVRGSGSYEHSHIAGAISAPEAAMAEWVDRLPRDVDLILYCI